MGYTVPNQYLTIEDVSCKLSNIKSLLSVISGEFFGHSQEYAMNNRSSVLANYETYANLVSVAFGLVAEAQDTLGIVETNVSEAIARVGVQPQA